MKEYFKKLSSKKIFKNNPNNLQNNLSKKEIKWLTQYKQILKMSLINFTPESQPKISQKDLPINKLSIVSMPHQIKSSDKTNS